MYQTKTLWLVAVFFAIVAAVSALPGPQPQGPVPASIAPARPTENSDKTDLKGDSSHGIGYAYGPWGYGGLGYGGFGYGGFGYGGYGGYGYGYGYPYGYAHGYPYYGGYGFYG